MPSINELGRLVKAKYPEYADMDDLQVGLRVKAKHPKEYADFRGRDEPFATKMIPGAGGLTGGIAGSAGGPVGTVGGAALGSAGGEAIRQNILHLMNASTPDSLDYITPQTPQEALGRIGGEAVWGAGSQIAGMGMAGAARGLANPVMRWAIRNREAGPAAAALRMSPSVLPTKGGEKQVGKAIRHAAAATRAAIVRGNRTYVDPVRLVNSALAKNRDKLRADFGGDAADAERFIDDLAERWIRRAQGRGARLTPNALQTQKIIADGKAKAVHKLVQANQVVSPTQQVEAGFNKAIADEIRKHLENTTADLVLKSGKKVSLKELNQRTADLKMLQESMTKANKGFGVGTATLGSLVSPLGAGIGSLAATGHPAVGIAGVAGGALLSHPMTLALAARGLNSPAARDALLRSPQLVRMLGTPPYPDTGGMP